MVLAREWQDRGRAHQLDVGQEYDLPDGVAASLLATGAAVEPDADRAVRPPETKPLVAPETKGKRSQP
jgi:hypothetical protein